MHDGLLKLPHHEQALLTPSVHWDTSPLHAAPQPNNELVVEYLGNFGNISFKILYSASNNTFSGNFFSRLLRKLCSLIR